MPGALGYMKGAGTSQKRWTALPVEYEVMQ